MLRLVIGRVCSHVLTVLLWTWFLLRLAFDWIGRSTVVDDYNQLVERLPRWAEWLFSTPWYVPASCATVLTVFLIWLSLPRSVSFNAPPAVIAPEPKEPIPAVLNTLATVLHGIPDQRIANLKGHNEDLQERLQWAERNANPNGMEAFAYLDPLDRPRLLIQWRSPIRDRNATLALDYKPIGEPSRRLILKTIMLIERQSTDTPICQANEDGTWVWATPENQIVHRGLVMCRLVLVASDGTPYYWRFAIADRDFKEAPRVVGEDVFEAEFP
jgi:hypothetical protein